MSSDKPTDDDPIDVVYVYYEDDSEAIHIPAGILRGGFCLWQFTEGRWVLKKESCEPGYEQGLPPVEKGTFEGHLVKTPCRRVPRNVEPL